MTIKPSKAKKKPVTIEVVQYIPGQYTKQEWLWHCPSANIGVKIVDSENDPLGLKEDEFVWFNIDTLEGAHEVLPYAWVAKGVKGEFYPIRNDIFEETYDLVEVEGVSVISFDPSVVK